MVDGKGKTKNNRAFFNQLMVGLALGVSGASMVFAMNFATFGVPSMERDEDFEATLDQLRLLASIVAIGAMLGNFIAGGMVDSMGRRTTIMAGALLYLFGYVLLAVSWTVTIAMVARVVCGVATSLTSLGGMIYMTEVVHPKVRDRIGSLMGILGNFGMLVAFVSGSVMEWRGMAWVGFVCASPLLIFIYMAESPNFLIKTGQKEEALQVLLKYRESATEARKEYEDILLAANKATETTASIGEMFSYPYITPLITSLVLLVAQQLTGINGITIKAVNLFEQLGTSIDPAYCTVMIAIVSMITAVVTSEIHSRFNRKPTLVVSTVLSSLSELFIGLFLLAKSGEGAVKEWADANSAWGLFTVLFFYVSFNVGLGPIPWIYMGEGIPSKVRGPASAISGTATMLFMFISMQIFDPLTDFLGLHCSLILLAVSSFFVTVLGSFIMFETKGKTVSQIDGHYLDLEKKKKE
ncbi:Major facilitator sugar transporter-like [Trinorchestia longiramus]|nr:Major facilitator sugar transporter-like [Trinorchestia longiramus]